jgi:predicted enzyme related to lactoylglutathione lyase
MKVTKTYFMVMVTDMERATSFYRDVFELSVRFATPEWTELAAGEAVVALHGGGAAGETREIGLGFEVDDVAAACTAVETSGGRVVVPATDRPGEGIKLAQVSDTEGNVFSVAESTWGK